MAKPWKFRFNPGVWVRDELEKVPTSGEDSWPLSDEQISRAIEVARSGGYWDDEWTPGDFDAASAWVKQWANVDATSNRQYDFVLVAPGGDEYSEDDVRRGYADDELRSSRLLD